MNGFLFFSRVAFVFNVLFIISLVIQNMEISLPSSLGSVLVLGGLVLSLVMNLVVNIWLIVLLARKKIQLKVRTVYFLNMVVLIFQLFIYFV
ncbi:MAG: hypothetical protein GXC73_12335 [Chitinophagaceae bacterium]|nr:hypothetical protein [Chitinophagaceae bacterium]